MLVLSRRLGESIRIGDNITITVLSQGGNSIRIGITAPTDIPVHRQEVYIRNKGSETETKLSTHAPSAGSCTAF